MLITCYYERVNMLVSSYQLSHHVSKHIQKNIKSESIIRTDFLQNVQPEVLFWLNQ